jgi:ubiquinol-cytochrome c reductase cytochrome c1 subunit
MARLVSVLAAGLAGGLLLAGPALAGSTELPPRDVHWSFEGPFGTYDQAQLQRGYKVYHEVCSNCHSMKMIAFRNLADKGGPFWNPKYPNPNDNPVAKSLAADVQVADIDSETGEPTKRPGTTADYLPSPYPNDVAARAANGGALPPDMSLLAKAREGGPAYIYSLLLGYVENPDPHLTVPDGKYYNPYMPGDMTSFWKGDPHRVPKGGFIAMPKQIYADRVAFDDGTKSGESQQAWDVAAFLNWAADPKLEERHKMGLAVMTFLTLFSALLYASYRGIWSKVGH